MPNGLGAVCASGVLLSYPLATDASDLCGGSDMTTVGTVPYTTIGGRACAGPTTNLNRFTLPAAADTALSGLAASSFGFSIYLNTLNAGVVFSTQDANAF